MIASVLPTTGILLTLCWRVGIRARESAGTTIAKFVQGGFYSTTYSGASLGPPFLNCKAKCLLARTRISAYRALAKRYRDLISRRTIASQLTDEAPRGLRKWGDRLPLIRN
jgi:hypothetical protein